MAGFLYKLKEKTSQLFSKLASVAHSIISNIESWIARIRKHQDYLEGVLASTPTYNPTEVDLKIVEELRRSMSAMAPEGIVSYLSGMHIEERLHFIEENLLPTIATSMGISYCKVVWMETDERLCGYYCHGNREIALNAAYLVTDNPTLLTILVNTIVHECRHARQWAAVEGKDLGYSKQTIEEWKRNFADYISSDESDEGYVKQPVEYDAAMFANSVINENEIFDQV